MSDQRTSDEHDDSRKGNNASGDDDRHQDGATSGDADDADDSDGDGEEREKKPSLFSKPLFWIILIVVIAALVIWLIAK